MASGKERRVDLRTYLRKHLKERLVDAKSPRGCRERIRLEYRDRSKEDKEVNKSARCDKLEELATEAEKAVNLKYTKTVQSHKEAESFQTSENRRRKDHLKQGRADSKIERSFPTHPKQTQSISVARHPRGRTRPGCLSR